MLDEGLSGVELSDLVDHEILMHRDVHFGGLFSLMLDYYQKEGRGVQLDFPLERILYLNSVEGQWKQNLAALLLSGPEAEKVAKAKEVYKELRSLYENNETDPNARLIADLILAESEQPKKEVLRIIAKGSELVPYLIQLIKTEEFYDPLFPGYGLTPRLAILALGKIGSPAAIPPLFEKLGRYKGFDIEAAILRALRRIGEPSKEFLLRILQSRPITKDNEQAAMVLANFSDDVKVAEIAFTQLQDKNVLQHLALTTYLILLTEKLRTSQHKEAFKAFVKSPNLSEDQKEEIRLMTRDW